MDHTENSLRAVVTSLRTVVTPAVDPGDPLAQQQLGLSIMYLEFLAARLPHLSDRDRFELVDAAELAAAVIAAAGPHAPWVPELVDAATRARRVATQPTASRDELRTATAVVTAVVNELIAGDLSEAARRAVEGAVVDHSARRVEFDRSWYLPMGFDPDPGSVTPWTDLIPPPL